MVQLLTTPRKITAQQSVHLNNLYQLIRKTLPLHIPTCSNNTCIEKEQGKREREEGREKGEGTHHMSYRSGSVMGEQEEKTMGCANFPGTCQDQDGRQMDKGNGDECCKV